MKIAVAAVLCGLVVAGCSSGSDGSASGPGVKSSVSEAPSIGGVLPPPSEPAPVADDTDACHVLLDPLQIGTVTSDSLDAIILALSFPNGTGADVVQVYRQTIDRAQASLSTDTLTSDISALSSYMDRYGTVGQAAPTEIRGTVDEIRSTCGAVGVVGPP